MESLTCGCLVFCLRIQMWTQRKPPPDQVTQSTWCVCVCVVEVPGAPGPCGLSDRTGLAKISGNVLNRVRSLTPGTTCGRGGGSWDTDTRRVIGLALSEKCLRQLEAPVIKKTGRRGEGPREPRWRRGGKAGRDVVSSRL